MQTVAVSMDDKVVDKVLWFLEHLKGDGVEVSTIEDIGDLQLILEAKKERVQTIPLEKILKEYGLAD